MKKVTSLLVFILFYFNVQGQVIPDCPDPQIRGRDCCGGTGTCSNVGVESSTINGKTAENKINFILPEYYFTEEQQRLIQDESQDFYFEIEEDVTLLEDTLQELGVSTKLNIVEAGKYAVFYHDEKYKIIVTLTSTKK